MYRKNMQNIAYICMYVYLPLYKKIWRIRHCRKPLWFTWHPGADG